jgi:hypothetical protein
MNRTLNQYEIRVTENNDYEDNLGIIDKITFTDVYADEYFYPDLYKIRFIYDFCDFKPDKFTLVDNNNNKYVINCNKTYIYYNSRSLFCYFNENINYYGNMDVYFGNELIKENIFASKTFRKVNFQTNSNIDVSNRLITYKISDPINEFYMDSVNFIYIQLNDGFNIREHIYQRDSNNETDIKLLLDNNILEVNILYKRGIIYTAIKLERKLFEDENIQFADDPYKFLNEQINQETLEKIYFEPDFILLENQDFSSSHFRTKLVFQNEKSRSDYGYRFCTTFYDYYERAATFRFECISDNDNYKIVELPREGDNSFTEDLYPGYIDTELVGYTIKAKLKVIKIEIVNKCQNNIFGDRNNLEDVIINVYYPIDGNKKITVKYDNSYNNGISKNDKVKITNNPFDYTFESFAINKDYLEQNRKVEILYDDQIVGTFNVDYANVIIPNFLQSLLLLHQKDLDYIQIKLLKLMKIGVDQTTFILRNID